MARTLCSSEVNRKVILWTTLIGGFFSSLVKWGSEVNMPPRMPGEISPPGANIDAWLGWLGFNQHSLDYMYQGNSVLGAVTILGYGEVREALSTLFKVAFIATILYSAHYGFQSFIVPGISGTRDFLINATGSGISDDSLYAKLDTLIHQGITIALSAWNQFDLFSTETYISGFWGAAILALTIILSMVMSFVMLGAEVILLLLVFLGPFFIVSFLFTSTRNFFFLWISAVFSNIILFVIGTFFISLAINGINSVVEKENIIQRIQAAENIKDLSRGDYIRSSDDYKQMKKNKADELSSLKENYERDYEAAGCGFFSSLSAQCKSLRNSYNQQRKDTEDKYKTLEKEVIDKHKGQYDSQKQMAEEPINHIIFAGIALLLAILIKVTFEIPSIAQTLSGGAGAGASAGALAAEVMRTSFHRAKRLAVGTTVATGAGAIYLGRKAMGYQSPMQRLLTEMKDMNKSIGEIKGSVIPSHRDTLANGTAGFLGGTFAGDPRNRPQTDSTNINANNTVNGHNGKTQVNATADKVKAEATANNAQVNASQANAGTATANDVHAHGATRTGGKVNATGDVNVSGSVNVESNNGRNLPSHAANVSAASGAIDAVRRENSRNELSRAPDSAVPSSAPQSSASSQPTPKATPTVQPGNSAAPKDNKPKEI